jgi:hypothetical protein
MFRLLGLLATVVLTLSGAWWVCDTQPWVRNVVNRYFQTGNFLTLEVRYTADQVMESHRTELLKDEQYVFLEPTLTFYPYLLMEVKYIRDDKGTGEGVMLWGLVDGEIVIDTSTWERTHAYEDSILSGASRTDFKIINTLAKKGGRLDREGLLNTLRIESDVLDMWLESCKKKQLVVQRGNDYRLHFERPKVINKPITKMRHRLVTKPFKHAERVGAKYTASQIESVAKAAFGSGFAVRDVQEVFLPVYSIAVQNPDGSTLTTEWNALTNEKIEGLSF